MTTKTEMKVVVGQLAVLSVIIATVAASGAGAPTITPSYYAEYKAEVVTSDGSLTITPKGVVANAQTRTAIGDTNATAVTMASAGNPIARTALTQGNWAYNVEIQAITGLTPASTNYKIDLKVNGTVTATLYVKSDSTPATGEKVTLSFDLGTATLGNEQSFVILAKRV